MTSRQQVMARANDLGATVNVSREDRHFVIAIEAPTGCHWPEGVHELVIVVNRGPWSTDHLWREALERMGAPEHCSTDCEWW